jgi:hypothetical protein
MAAVGSMPESTRREGSLGSELVSILGFPLRGPGLAVVSVAALLPTFLAGSLWYMLFYLISLLAYQAKTVTSVAEGDDFPPAKPAACGEAPALALPIVAATFVCFLPLMLVLLLAGRGASKEDPTRLTIGSSPVMPKDTSSKALYASVGDVELRHRAGRETEPVKIGNRAGRWLVLARLSDPVVHEHKALEQFHDMGRLSNAVPAVDVAVTVEEEESERTYPALKQWLSPELLPEIDQDNGRITGPPELLELGQRYGTLRGCGIGWLPGKLGHAIAPTVWIIDPSGSVKREFEGGASDVTVHRALYDLGAAGSKPASGGLTGVAGTIRSFVLFGLLLAGAAYYPIGLLMTLFGTGFIAFNYPLGLRSIRAAIGDYVTALGISVVATVLAFLAFIAAVGSGLFTGLLWIGGSLGETEAGVAGMIVRFVAWWIVVYGVLVQSCTIGRLHARNRDLFPWAKPPARSS